MMLTFDTTIGCGAPRCMSNIKNNARIDQVGVCACLFPLLSSRGFIAASLMEGLIVMFISNSDCKYLIHLHIVAHMNLLDFLVDGGGYCFIDIQFKFLKVTYVAILKTHQEYLCNQ